MLTTIWLVLSPLIGTFTGLLNIAPSKVKLQVAMGAKEGGQVVVRVTLGGVTASTSIALAAEEELSTCTVAPPLAETVMFAVQPGRKQIVTGEEVTVTET